MTENLGKYRLENDKILFKSTEDGRKIRIGIWKARSKKKCGTIFFLNGHREFIEKYSETFYDLSLRGFNVITWDWRGWGLSERPFPNKPKVQHIEYAAEYQNDIDTILKIAKKEKLSHPWHMLAHSMGCLIGLRRLSKMPDSFENYVFLAPLWGSMRFIPQLMQTILIRCYPALKSLGLTKLTSGNSKNYQPYALKVIFEKNTLTSDHKQFIRLKNILQENPELHSGIPTLGYLIAILEEMKNLKNLILPEKPVTVFIAEKEQITDNESAKKFILKNPFIKLIEIKNSKHEMLIEKKNVRKKILYEIEYALGRNHKVN